MYLNVGDEVPKFSIKDFNEKKIALDDLRDSQFILWFFPKANTPG